jgi:outer membrane PBP1 activator LpoA protein
MSPTKTRRSQALMDQVKNKLQDGGQADTRTLAAELDLTIKGKNEQKLEKFHRDPKNVKRIAKKNKVTNPTEISPAGPPPETMIGGK